MFAALSLCVMVAMGASTAQADDVGIAVKRLIITDLYAKNGTGRVTYLARLDNGIQKGVSGDPKLLDATLDIFYTDDKAAGTGHFNMFAWQENTRRARYRNKNAPDEGGVRTAMIRPERGEFRERHGLYQPRCSWGR